MQANLSDVPFLVPEIPTSANNAFLPLFSETLEFDPVFVKLDTVYRIKRMYFPMFYVSVRHEPTGCKEKFVDAALATLEPLSISKLCWIKLDSDGAIKFSTAGIFHSTPAFQKLMEDNHFTMASGSMDIKTKMYHINHAKMIIASYGGTFSMARILRSRPKYMQRLLLLVHDDYRGQLAQFFSPYVGKIALVHAGINHGEFLFFDHVWDKYAFRIPAKPIPNLLVKVIGTSNLNNLRQEDLDDWNMTGRDYRLYYAERLVIMSATYGSATAKTTHCNNVSIASLVEKSMRKGVISPARRSERLLRLRPVSLSKTRRHGCMCCTATMLT